MKKHTTYFIRTMKLTAGNLSREQLRKPEMKRRKLNCKISNILKAVVPSQAWRKLVLDWPTKHLHPVVPLPLNGKAMDKQSVLINRR